MPTMKTPTPRLVAGLIFTLAVIFAYAGYTLYSVSRMRQVQSDIVDRNRKDSLQLIRIQNDLNALALAMRDILDNPDGYPISAWKAPLERIRLNLQDAIVNEAALAQGRRAPEQTAYLRSSFDEFWRTCNTMFDRAAQGNDAAAREMVRGTLQPRQEALSALAARLLVANNEEEARGGTQVREIYSGIETTAYRFLAVSVVLTVLMGAGIIRSNRALFRQLSELAEQRSELARQLISTQESTLRAISRDLHDEFGQILTALGAMLRRATRLAPDTTFKEQVQEAAQVVQGTLENIRSLSQSLQPVILDEQGLQPAIEWHLPVFERQTGIRVKYEAPATRIDARSEPAVHVFRILQESLNNVARHSGVEEVRVALGVDDKELTLVIEDHGAGISPTMKPGVGLAAMRERATLIGGSIQIGAAEPSGTRIALRAQIEGLAREVAVG